MNNEEIVLQHQLEEWKYLNEYVNKMDIGYQQTFALFVTLLTGVLAFISKDINSTVAYGIFLIPFGIIAVLSYISYQFRITAILRGHLAALEDDMNKKLNKNVHLWNSALVETFMAHNNSINNKMIIPMFGFVVALAAYCIVVTYWILNKNFLYIAVWLGYWAVIIILAVIVIKPFFMNDCIRSETYNEEKVVKNYKKYLQMKQPSSKFKYENIEDD